jgi:hypothetical protein
MITFNESDYDVVKWIQELKGCTVARAKQIFIQKALRLAQPDLHNRHEIVWEAVKRGEKISDKPKEKRQVAPEKAEKPKKAKKAAAPKAVKAAKPKPEPRVEIPLAELTREVELTQSNDEKFKNFHTATLFGKKHAAFWIVVNHEDQGTAARFGPAHLSEQRIAGLKEYASQEGLPLAVCVAVRIKGRLDQGYAIAEELLKKFSTKMSRGRISLSLSHAARSAYRETGWDNCKFSEKPSPESKAA